MSEMKPVIVLPVASTQFVPKINRPESARNPPKVAHIRFKTKRRYQQNWHSNDERWLNAEWLPVQAVTAHSSLAVAAVTPRSDDQSWSQWYCGLNECTGAD